MTAQDTHGFISLEKRVMFFNTSRNLKMRWRSKQENPSKSFAQIKGESTNWGTSSSSIGIEDHRNSTTMLRSMMKGKNLSNYFWVEAIKVLFT
jgi:hypothetical protein